MVIHTTKIVCGFPGVGKTYLFNKQDELNIKVTDSDSSKFSKIKDANGNLIQNPDFPKNYIEHIKSLIHEFHYNYIFISSHIDVRKALHDNHIPYTLIYPTKDMKDAYIQRYRDRGSPDAFIKLLESKFDQFVYDCEKDTLASAKVIFDLPSDTLYDWVVQDLNDPLQSY